MYAPVKGVGWCVGTPYRKSTNVFGKKQIGIFKDPKSSEIFLLDNVCPHRGALFSQGKVFENKKVQCPYHGWIYNENGLLESVPSCVNKSIPTGADISKYEVNQQYDFLWTSFDNVCALPPEVEDFSDPHWNYVTGDIELEGNWMKWIDNACDVSHINFVHDFADENRGKVSEFRVNKTDRGYYECTANVRPKAASVFTHHMQVKKSSISMRFYFPNTTVIRVKLKDPYEFVTYTTVTPLGKDRTLMTWCFGYNLPFNNDIIMHNFVEQMYKTIKEDQAIIKNIPRDFNNTINVQSDTFQTAVSQELEYLISIDPMAVKLM